MKIVTIALVAFLVGMFCYQVAYGTNKSSYHYGWLAGFGTYQCRITEGGCDGPGVSSNDINTDCVGLAANSGGQDTNSTACTDGFIAGFVHWCGIHQKDCVSVFKLDEQPSTQIR